MTNQETKSVSPAKAFFGVIGFCVLLATVGTIADKQAAQKERYAARNADPVLYGLEKRAAQLDELCSFVVAPSQEHCIQLVKVRGLIDNHIAAKANGGAQ